MYSELIKIEESILNNTFQVKKELWGGAGQTVRLITGNEIKPGVVEHRDAYAISTLVFKLKDIIPYDYLDKYELFGELLVDLPEEEVLMEIMERAKRFYRARTEIKLVGK